MAQDSKDLNLNLHQWQRDLLVEFLNSQKSENPQRVFLPHRRQGKSWMKKWLLENLPLLLKQSDVNYVVPQRIIKELISTSALRNKQKISGANYDIIIYDEFDYPVDPEMKEKLDKILELMKNSIAKTTK